MLPNSSLIEIIMVNKIILKEKFKFSIEGAGER
jgi:hypothetical protein